MPPREGARDAPARAPEARAVQRPARGQLRSDPAVLDPVLSVPPPWNRQYAGRKPIPDRAVVTGILFVLRCSPRCPSRRGPSRPGACRVSRAAAEVPGLAVMWLRMMSPRG